ncbi:MAG: tyrosine--tRNA ligase [Ignavibacteriae bacterium]|nr:tyrosine--tRNA ligase [Ignavibacteriota bacterium]
MNYSLNEQMDVLKKGTVEIIPEEELVRKIEKSIKQNKPLNIKLGCDPSVPDLHIGHSVVLNKLREFQDLGHTAILIVGDFTGMIGDPSGKKKTRPQLTFEETKENGKSYFEQASVILDRDKTKIVYNSEWLSKLDLHALLGILGKFTVQRILERDDFTNRLKEHQEISMHELLYPIMQGYDSYAIDADVELGGTDQKFNNLVGRDMQKRFGKDPQVVMLMPLLEGTDGNEKMSKSLNNYIGISEDPKDIFGKTMSIPDILIYKYFTLATRLSPSELADVKKTLENPDTNPRDIKRRLGFEIVKLYYDEKTANEAISGFDKIFIKKEIPDEIPEYTLDEKNIKLTAFIVKTGMAESNAAARRLIEQGGVSMDGEKIEDVNYIVAGDSGFVLKVGKRKFLKVKIY